MSPTQWSRIAKNESAFPGETLLAVMGDAVARAQVHQRAGDRAARIRAMERYRGFAIEAQRRGIRLAPLADQSLLEGVPNA